MDIREKHIQATFKFSEKKWSWIHDNKKKLVTNGNCQKSRVNLRVKLQPEAYIHRSNKEHFSRDYRLYNLLPVNAPCPSLVRVKSITSQTREPTLQNYHVLNWTTAHPKNRKTTILQNKPNYQSNLELVTLIIFATPFMHLYI